MTDVDEVQVDGRRRGYGEWARTLLAEFDWLHQVTASVLHDESR